MANQWYITRHGATSGPYSSRDLATFAASGHLLPTDLVWKDGMTEWQPAARLKGLFGPPPVPALPAVIPLPALPALPVAGYFPPPAAVAASEIVHDDPDAEEAWDRRESPMARRKGLFSGLLKKRCEQFLFQYKYRTPQESFAGRAITREDLLDKLARNYEANGFQVTVFTHSLMAVHLHGKSSSADSANSTALAGVGTKTNVLVRLVESGTGYVLDAKGEAYFWPLVLEQLASGVVLVFFALIFFWPCLCLLPFAFGMEGDEVKLALQQQVKLPLEKLVLDLS